MHRGIEAAFWGTLGKDPELRTSRSEGTTRGCARLPPGGPVGLLVGLAQRATRARLC